MKIKIKVLSIEKKEPWYYYDHEDARPVIQGITKWDEIERTEYSKLADAVQAANNNKQDKNKYFIVHQIEDYQEIFDSAAQYIEYQEVQEKKRKKADEEYKLKQEEKRIERKKKQLEKLKRELESQKIP